MSHPAARDAGSEEVCSVAKSVREGTRISRHLRSRDNEIVTDNCAVDVGAAKIHGQNEQKAPPGKADTSTYVCRKVRLYVCTSQSSIERWWNVNLYERSQLKRSRFMLSL